ncbi:unnamed protein product [Brassicogethes aeneus]|uniref:Uncharacterized protein n=1 Tax=Brassicogethes aeneus TaxID=1431903 RepID=A0A9P0F9P7_BRAAE|nr:unnamed protein product [Brassicogethes aeneus]
MYLYSSGKKARYGVTREEQKDLFTVSADYSLAHCVAEDLRMSRGIAVVFKNKFGRVDDLRRQNPKVGEVLEIVNNEQIGNRSIFYLVTKQLSHQKPNYRDVWNALNKLRNTLLSKDIMNLAIPKIACGLDGLDWRIIRSMVEVIFRFSSIHILVCCHNPKRTTGRKTVDSYFYRTSQCKFGSLCKYRHGAEDHFRDENVLRRGQCSEFGSGSRNDDSSPMSHRR